MQVQIIHGGNPLPVVHHEGQHWAIAPSEGEYAIRLYNNSSKRRFAVVSVDGLSVMDGKPAKRDGNGYVLRPYETLTIPGWRRSASEVAAFEFTANEGSYSEAMGHGTRNTGVIGVVVYDEKPKRRAQPFVRRRFVRRPPPWWVYWPYTIEWDEVVDIIETIGNDQSHSGTTTIYSASDSTDIKDASFGINSVLASTTCSIGGDPSNFSSGNFSSSDTFAAKGITRTSATLPTASADAEDVDLGTAYGQATEFNTSSVYFDRADKPCLEIVIRYGTAPRLQRFGVPVEQAMASVPSTPDPFPEGDCPAPPGWAQR